MQRQRDKEIKGDKRDKEIKRQRDKEIKRQRDKERHRARETKRYGETHMQKDK